MSLQTGSYENGVYRMPIHDLRQNSHPRICDVLISEEDITYEFKNIKHNTLNALDLQYQTNIALENYKKYTRQ